MRRQCQVGVGVQIHRGAAAGHDRSDIRFAHTAFQHHFRGIEDVHQRRSAIELVSFPGMAEGVSTISALQRDHAGERGGDVQAFDVRLGALHRDLLAVALQFQDSQGGQIGLIVQCVGFLEALHVKRGNAHFFFVSQALDLAQHRAFAQFDARRDQIGFRLQQIGGPFFGIRPVLGALLVGLVAEIVKLGVGVSCGVHLGSGVEAGDRVARPHLRAILDDMGERHLIVLTGNLRHQNLSGVHCLYYTGNTNLVSDFLRLGLAGRRRRVGHLSRESTAGSE